MSARVEKRFDQRFELNEESIRRIHSDIRKRTPEENHKDIIFEVFREDSLVFRTSEIDRILSESNDSTQKIKELQIEYNDAHLNILLSFSAEDGADLTITGEDRDQVYLISSELKEYIQKEVCHLKAGKFDAKFLLIPIFIFTVSILFIFRSSTPPNNALPIEDVIASTDTNAKLNHLIELASQKSSMDQKSGLIGMVPFLFALLIFIPGQKIFNYLFPGNIFMIGKQVNVITSRRASIKNFFWGGFIAAVIAFGSGYYFLWLAK